jgi:hypothetical protein
MYDNRLRDETMRTKQEILDELGQILCPELTPEASKLVFEHALLELLCDIRTNLDIIGRELTKLNQREEENLKYSRGHDR